jgi:DNA-binding NarL/FixJ family response regulator
LTPLREIIGNNRHAQTTIAIDPSTDDFIQYKRKRDPNSKAARAYVIAQLIAKGYTIAEIAHKLDISKRAAYKILKRNSR